MTDQRFKAHMWLFGGGELHTTPGLCELPVSLLSKELGRPGVLSREVVLVCPTFLQALWEVTSTIARALSLAKIKK